MASAYTVSRSSSLFYKGYEVKNPLGQVVYKTNSQSSAQDYADKANAAGGAKAAGLSGEEADLKTLLDKQLKTYLGLNDEGAISGDGWRGTLKMAAYKAIQEGKTLDTSGWKVVGGRNTYKVVLKDGTQLSLGALKKYDDEGPRIQAVLNAINEYNTNAKNLSEFETTVSDKKAADEEAKAAAEAEKQKQLEEEAARKEAAEEAARKAEEENAAAEAERKKAVEEALAQARAEQEELIRVEAEELAAAKAKEEEQRRLTEELRKAEEIRLAEEGRKSGISDRFGASIENRMKTAPVSYTSAVNASESALPDTVSYRTSYAGTVGNIDSSLVTTAPGSGEFIGTGYKDVPYTNKYGAQMMITELNGKPITAVPPGYSRGKGIATKPLKGDNTLYEPKYKVKPTDVDLGREFSKPIDLGGSFAEGGTVKGGDTQTEALFTIAKMNGYKGPQSSTALKAFFNSSDALKAKARAIGVALARGGMVRGNLAQGGAVLYADEGVDVSVSPDFQDQFFGQAQDTITQTMTPRQATVKGIIPTAGDFIPEDAGQVLPLANMQEASTVPITAQAQTVEKGPTMMYDAALGQPQVSEALYGTERDYKKVSAADAGFTPPPRGSMVTQAFETFHNPTTGEQVLVPSGGYTAPKGWVKGAPQGKFKTEGVTAAQGEVSKEAQAVAAQGELSPEAKADAAAFDPNYIDSVFAGQRNVTAQELAQAQGLDEEAVKANIAQANVPENIKAAQTTVKPEELPKPAQIAESEMAQAEAITMSGLTTDATATAAKLAKFSLDEGTLVAFKEGKIEAQDTVQGQLSQLMKDFDDGTPAWAAGAMRAANAAMAARGLGGSSMAAAAIVQATMESAIPIAAADAEAFRSMKMDNLNRQQQVALTNAAAQQGVELANFNAEQQAALQNSQNAFGLQSQNLSNMQQAVLANAQIKSALQGQNLTNEQQSNLVVAARYAEASNLNLSNLQQAVLQGSQNNLQVDLANLSSKQQSYITNAQLEAALQGKTIDNRQQTAITNAARFSEANNLTFTAQQQAQLHNSELMKTVGLANLNSKQASTLQNAAQIAAMDMANLSNKQQVAVQNAQAFLQMDMSNLTNEQQAAMFKAQAVQQSILTDQAAENASLQFNASSENQADQFFANLATQTSTFNAAQQNAMAQYNTDSINSMRQFNAGLQEQRDMFNAQNGLVVAQANANWRQNIATINTAAQNQSNMEYARTMNSMTAANLDQYWQRERDIMSFAFTSAENAADRIASVLLQELSADQQAELADQMGKGTLFGKLVEGALEWGLGKLG